MDDGTHSTSTSKPTIDLSCLSTALTVEYRNTEYYKYHPAIKNSENAPYFYKLRSKQRSLAKKTGLYDEADIIDPDPFQVGSYYIFRIIPKPPSRIILETQGLQRPQGSQASQTYRCWGA
jgi:hypothetical protein